MRVENKRTYKGPGIYVGRPTRWGNPYSHLSHAKAMQVRTADEAIALFADHALRALQQDPEWLDPLVGAEALICWCAPNRCHASILVAMVMDLPRLKKISGRRVDGQRGLR